MELKQGKDLLILLNDVGLNRTFYGIETRCPRSIKVSVTVLIVPFMELKLTN